MGNLKIISQYVEIQDSINQYFLKYIKQNGKFSSQILSYKLSNFCKSNFEVFHIYCPQSITKSVVKRQAEFFYGRLVAKYALCNIGVEESVIQIGSFREPVWPLSINGSITHTDKIAASIVTNISSLLVGIDVENIIDNELNQVILKYIVSDVELKYLKSQQKYIAFDFLFTLVFSAKEALYKAIFPLLRSYIGFDYVEIRDIDYSKNIIELEITKSLSSTFVRGYLCYIYYKFSKGTVITLCVIDRDQHLNFF